MRGVQRRESERDAAGDGEGGKWKGVASRRGESAAVEGGQCFGAGWNSGSVFHEELGFNENAA